MSVGNLAAPFAAFIVSPIIAQQLGVDGRGEVAAGTAVLLLFSAVGLLGLVEAATYYVATRKASPGAVFRRAFFYLVLSGAILTVANYFLAPFVSAGNDDVIALVRIAGAAIIPSLLLGAVRGIAQGQHRWTLVVLEKYVSAGLRLIPIAILAAFGQLTSELAVVVLAFSPVAGGLVYLLLMRDNPDESAYPRAKPRLLSFGLRMWIGSLSGILLSRLDQALMVPLSGVFELGIYVAAVNVSEILLVAQSAIGQVLFSADARDQRNERMYLGSRLSISTCLAAGLVIGATAAWWVPFLFGPDFLPSVPVVWILIAGTVIGAPGSVSGTVLSARGRPGLKSISLLLAVVVNAALLWALVPSYGATGAGLATVAGIIVATTLNLYFARRLFGLSVTALCLPRFSDFSALIVALKKRDGETDSSPDE